MHTVSPHGVEVPALGFGTARFDDNDRCREAVECALEVGYRHVDTAQMYGTEPAVGAALNEADVDRDEVFLTTKLDNDNRTHDRVVESTRESLDALDTDYVDLLLIHSPNDSVPLEETMDALNEIEQERLVSHIGVSNFSPDQLREAIDLAELSILTNQVEYNPHHGQADLLRTCLEEGVMLTAYSPLDVGSVIDNDTLVSIGDAHGKTPAQVAIRWLLQQPLVGAIPKAASEAHVRENFDVFDFELSSDEMDRIFAGAGGVPDVLVGELTG